LKPENILVDKHLQLKLIDFGQSNDFVGSPDGKAPDTRIRVATGSKPYSCKKVFSGEDFQAFENDIHQLGVTLFVMACGRFPFAENYTGYLRNLFEASYQDNLEAPKSKKAYWDLMDADLSEDFKELIFSMLHPDPSQRPSLRQLERGRWYRSKKRDLRKGVKVAADVAFFMGLWREHLTGSASRVQVQEAWSAYNLRSE
jgi:carbon catabolite-derepressing protein kinase